MRAPESLIPVLEQLCTVLEQLCQVEADKLTVISADHPDQLESLLNDENMLLLQLRGLDKKRSDLLRRSGLEGLTFRQILMQEDSEEVRGAGCGDFQGDQGGKSIHDFSCGRHSGLWKV